MGGLSLCKAWVGSGLPERLRSGEGSALRHIAFRLIMCSFVHLHPPVLHVCVTLLLWLSHPRHLTMKLRVPHHCNHTWATAHDCLWHTPCGNLGLSHVESWS